MKVRRRTTGALVICGGVAVLAWLAHRPARSRVDAAPPPAKSTTTWTAREPRHVDAPPHPTAQGEVRFIDEVRLDRQDACVNEPIVVDVVAHDPRPQPLPLTVRVGLRDGSPNVFVGASAGDKTIFVDALDGAGTLDRRSVTVRVRDCEGYEFVRVEAQQVPGREAYRFYAKAVGRGESFTYRFDFGDGATATSPEGFAQHDFADRPQTSAQSTFLVRVDAESDTSGTVTGVAAVSFRNTSYGNKLRTRAVTPTIDVGFAVREQDRWRVPIVVHNPEPTSLAIDGAALRVTRCGEDRPRALDVAAARVLDRASFPPGRTSASLVLEGDLAGADDCVVSVMARGAAGDGSPVLASFGAGLATPPNARLVDAPAEVARLEKAAAILGRDLSAPGAVVTIDEIETLKRRGKVE